MCDAWGPATECRDCGMPTLAPLHTPLPNIHVCYYNGRRMTSRRFRSGRRLVQFLRTTEVVHIYHVSE